MGKRILSILMMLTLLFSSVSFAGLDKTTINGFYGVYHSTVQNQTKVITVKSSALTIQDRKIGTTELTMSSNKTYSVKYKLSKNILLISGGVNGTIQQNSNGTYTIKIANISLTCIKNKDIVSLFRDSRVLKIIELEKAQIIKASAVTDTSISIPAIKSKTIAVGEIIKIEKNPSKGFFWPYYLYVPANIDEKKTNYIFVESNNQPVKQVAYELTDESAYGTANKNKMYSDALGMPSIVPVFPGTDDISKVNSVYLHAINENALLIETEEYKRVDLQLIAMIDDARDRLSRDDININEKVIINGFSDSGNFSNRFTGLHPERVKVMVAGGINVFLFPIEEYNGIKYNYPLGISDFSKYSSKAFNKEAYDKVAKFIYRGTADKTDPAYGTNFMSVDTKNFIFQNIGQDILKRLEVSKQLYETTTKNLQFAYYDGIAHVVNKEISNDIIDFVSSNLGDEFKTIKTYDFANVSSFYKEVKKAYYLGNREVTAYAASKFGISGPGTSPINAISETLGSSDFIVCVIIGDEPVSNEVNDIFKELTNDSKREYSNFTKKNGKYYILIEADSNKKALDLLEQITIEKLMGL